MLFIIADKLIKDGHTETAGVAGNRSNGVDALLVVESGGGLVLRVVGDWHTFGVDSGVGDETTVDGQTEILNGSEGVVHHELTPGHVQTGQMLIGHHDVGQQEGGDGSRAGQSLAVDGHSGLVDAIRIIWRQQTSVAVEGGAPVGEGQIVASTVHQSVLVVAIALDVGRFGLVDVTVFLV